MKKPVRRSIGREEKGHICALLKALSFAAIKHSDQRRKNHEASPYINHPIAVAETLCSVGDVWDVSTLVAAILHDTIEDTETDYEELVMNFGAKVARMVEEVSDDQTLPSLARRERQVEEAAQKSLGARQIRIADKICNLQDVLESPPAFWSRSKRRQYIDWAEAVIAQVRGTNPRLESHFDEACRKARSNLG